MALTRKLLKNLGLTEEQVEAIIEAHLDSINVVKDDSENSKAEAEKYKADAERLASVQKELDDLKAAIAEEKKANEGKDYDALKSEFDAYKAEQEGKELSARKSAAYRALLSSMNMSEKGISKASKYFDLSRIELTKEGKIKDEDSIRTATAEEWGEYLPEIAEVKNDVPTPPANTGGGDGLTKQDIMAIKDATERQKAIAEHLDLFQ